ncbi:MAG: hypothetical protein IH856_15815 [Deltaproteobacteria bacterium]|nr:hypothetical protein [Deltaproteobacteria bacterium]
MPIANGCHVSVLSLLLVFLSGAGTALAHGNHGDAALPAGGISIVTLKGFQVEFLTSPRPPRAVQGNKIVLIPLII